MTSAAPSSARNRHIHLLVLVGGLLMVAAIAYFVYSEMQRAEQDRHAVIQEVRELERMIRRHDGQVFMRVGGPDVIHAEKDRESILRDLELLSHIEDFAIRDLNVSVTGDSATAEYVIGGSVAKVRGGGSPAPVKLPEGGEMTFARHGDRWEIVAHRFVPLRSR